MQTLSIPLGWIAAGADLELDILPTLEVIGRRAHGQGIGTWGYFSSPVAAAVQARKAGFPDVPMPAGNPVQTDDGEIFRQHQVINERLRAKLRAEGVF